MTRRIRILFFCAYPQRMAGANRATLHLIRNLPAHIDPVVVFPLDGSVPEAFREAGLDVHILATRSALSTFGKSMLSWSLLKRGQVALTELAPYVRALYKFIRAQRVDLVHVTDARAAWLASPAAVLANVRVVGHLQGDMPFRGVGRIPFERLSRAIVAVSESTRQTLSPAAIGKSRTVHYGIDDVSVGVDPSRETVQLRSEGKLVVTCFASVVPFKGHAHLLDAVAALNQDGWHERLRVLCLGDLVPEYEEYQKLLMQKRDRLGADNVQFLGWRANPYPYYAGTDIAVLPSVREEALDLEGARFEVRGNEGLPITHIESLWFGLPIVGTRIAGVPEQVRDGVNGFVVEPGDGLALANALRSLLSSPDLRHQYGRASRGIAESDFSTGAYISGLVDVYESVLAASR